MRTKIDLARMNLFRVMKRYGRHCAVSVKYTPFLTNIFPVENGLIVKTLYLLKHQYGRVKPGQKLVACGMLTPSFQISYFPVSDFLDGNEKNALHEQWNSGFFKRDYMVKMIDTRTGVTLRCNFETGFTTQQETDIYTCAMIDMICKQGDGKQT